MEQRKRILVVDDEPSNRDLLEAHLTALGHDVDMAADGAEALAKLDASHDLVLLDVMMAGIDGFETARRIRGESAVPDIPICMVTALTSKEERLRAVEAGANDFITKPIDKMELKIRTGSLLRAKEAQDAVKRYQAELEEKNVVCANAYEQLSKLSELKDDFLRIASHDLKNPLTCIIGLASILERQAPPGTPMTDETHGWVVKISDHCDVMQNLIRDFLEFQAMEDGQIKMIREAVDINELANATMERNTPYAQSKQIAVALDLAPGSLIVNADKNRITQVLENIVGNAIKFGQNGDQVTIRTCQTDDGVLIEVCDTGPGITEEDMKKLFMKYTKLSNKPTGDEKSSGLGLAICKKVIDMQGGHIGARANPDGGTTFWFELPTGE